MSYHGFAYGDIEVPPGTKRLVVVLTWDEPPASAGASRAVMYDVDLWVDRGDLHRPDRRVRRICVAYPPSTTSSTSSSTIRRAGTTG